MDDLSQQINQILNNPQQMQMLQAMARNLGLAPPEESAAPPAPPAVDLGQLLSQIGNVGGQNTPPSPPALDMNAMLQIQRAMSLFNQGNQSVDLLRALRPLLSQTRQKKVDDAIRILQMLQMLPLLKESGFFGGDLR